MLFKYNIYVCSDLQRNLSELLMHYHPSVSVICCCSLSHTSNKINSEYASPSWPHHLKFFTCIPFSHVFTSIPSSHVSSYHSSFPFLHPYTSFMFAIVSSVCCLCLFIVWSALSFVCTVFCLFVCFFKACLHTGKHVVQIRLFIFFFYLAACF